MHSDIFYTLEILFMLFGILVACQVFTNAIENLGDKLSLGHEFTGSVLAAVGTALPETLLPLVAIFLATQNPEAAHVKNDIAIGAIIGAPFMLATLAFFLTGLSVLLHKEQRQAAFKGAYDTEFLKINIPHLKRDLKYFLITFAIGISVAYFPVLHHYSHYIAYSLLGLYVIYLYRTYQKSAEEVPDDEEDETHTPDLYFTQYFKLKSNMLNIILQTLVGVIGIIYFAHHFIDAIEHIAHSISLSPLILSLIISPIATELPEKVNTWLWAKDGKDTLALGNVTGAMVFQSAIPCFIGIMLTPWNLDRLSFICASLAVISTTIIYAKVSLTNKLGYKTLLITGSLYLVYLILIFI